jgi:hypothetical protein
MSSSASRSSIWRTVSTQPCGQPTDDDASGAGRGAADSRPDLSNPTLPGFAIQTNAEVALLIKPAALARNARSPRPARRLRPTTPPRRECANRPHR